MPGPTHSLGDPGAGTLRIDIDVDHQRYLTAQRYRAGLWDPSIERARLEPVALDWLRSVIEADQPGRLQTGTTLDDLVGQLQEDLVIMHCPPGSNRLRARAAYVNVNLPSSWCPDCTVGMPFLRIHSPVPNADEFGGDGRRRAAEMLFSGQELVRFVWTLIPDDTLDRRRCHRADSFGERHESRNFDWETTERLFLRVERQVIAPINETASAFLIRVYHTPTDTLDAAQRSVLRAALTAMPDAVRRYKGLPENLDHSSML